jgi:phage tail tape-measure protein
VQNISCTYIGAKSFGFISQTIFVAFNLRGTPGNLYSISGAITKAGTWYMGANSVDGGNNTGVVFSNGSGIDYLNVSYITGSSFPVQGNFLELF